MANTKTYFLDNRVVKASKSVESLKKLKDLFNLNELIQKLAPAYIPPAPKYKVYSALLTQAGGTFTTPVILENSFDNPIVWSVPSNGVFRGTLTGAFTANKTAIFTSGNYNFFTSGYSPNANFVQISFVDNLGAQTSTPNVTNMCVDIRACN